MTLTQEEILNTTTPVQDGLLRISRSGRVFSRKYHHPHMWKESKITRLNRKNSAHYYVSVSVNQKPVRFSLHRLMAEAFVVNPNPDTHTYVLAADHNILNIDPDNLYWATPDMFYRYKLSQRRALQDKNTKRCIRCDRRFRKDIAHTDHCPRCQRQYTPRTRACGFCDRRYRLSTDKPCCSDCYPQFVQKAERLSDYYYMYTEIIDVNALTDFERRCVTLRLQDKTYPEIARVLHDTPQHIKQTFTHIHKKERT